MAEARRRDNWAHTSAIVAMVANTARDPKVRRKPFVPSEFDPYRRAVPVTERADHFVVSFDILKMFVPGAK